MRAILLREPGAFEIIEQPEPVSPAHGEAVVRVHAVGICGTDYGGYLGKMPFYSYPRIPGHELGVTVESVGEGVTNVTRGDMCTVEPYINCQRCYSCVRGLTNCCEHHQTLGVHCDGGLRRFFTVPARKLHPVTGLSHEQLALTETLAIGCHAVDRARLAPGERALVIGAGPIGLSAMEFLRIAGNPFAVMDLAESRLAFCRERMGAALAVKPDADGGHTAGLRAFTEGHGFDAVIDATGHDRSMSECLEFAAFGGRVVYVGITQKELAFPHAPIMHRRELTLLASRNALSSDFPRIAALIKRGQIDTDAWITHRVDFDSLIPAFPAWLNPTSGVIKAVVQLD
jgi:alcohol dehydrogenase